MAKYTPKNKYELKKLVADESIYLGDIDTSNITDMERLFCYQRLMFGYQNKRHDFSGIETWDTSNVITMVGMFLGADNFNRNINSWNVSNVVDMFQMFNSAKSFNQPLDNWNVSNVVNMCYMFSGAKSFNQPLDNWDTSNVKIMGCMFKDAESFNQNLDLWNVDSVVSNVDMFKNSGIKTLPKWWSEKVIEHPQTKSYPTIELMTSDFYVSKAMCKHIKKDAQSGKYVPKSRNELWALCYNSDISLGDIDTSNITDMQCIFDKSGRKDFSGIETWDTSKVVDMSFMFSEIDTFNKNISSWNVSNVVSMRCMFYKAKSFNQPLDSWDTSSVEFMGSMFQEAKSFNQNIDSWNVGNVRDNVEMFWDSGMDKLPKWYKKKEIGDNDIKIMVERIAEVLANPQTKAKPQQSRAQSGDFDFNIWQGKSTIILCVIGLLIGLSAAFIKNMSKESNKAKSPPTQTTQPAQNQKSAQSAQNMPRCDNIVLLNHLVETHKNNIIEYYSKNEKAQNVINQAKFNIKNVMAISSNEASREIVCEVEIEEVYLSNSQTPNQTITTITVYKAQLNDNDSIGFEFLGYKNTNP